MHIGSTSRIKLANHAQWHCCWCGQQTRKEMGWQNSATIEHVVPVSQGGTNAAENLVSACWRCNQKRGNTPADQFAIAAQTWPADSRTTEEANNVERQQIRKARMEGVLPPASISPAKLREREHKHAARRAYVEDPSTNPFEYGSRPWRMFEKLAASGGDWWTTKQNLDHMPFAAPAD
jgi:hypothetical protein